MVAHRFSRTELLLGTAALATLAHARVAVFGIGGVGGFAVEALARSGVGALDIVDSDVVSESNINRQIIATTASIGRSKLEVMRERILDINPDCTVTVHNCFYLPATADQFDLSVYDYVIDAVDTVTAKLHLIQEAQRCNTPIISCMGTGNKIDPTKIVVARITETSVCPLAKVIRKECRKRGIAAFKVVYSTEPSREPDPVLAARVADEIPEGRRALPGSSAFVPAAAGLALAAEVVKDLIA